jgi:NAD(P)-dependent dehydrogenase (short-subunit alcohol dehydrogenase family)
MAKKTMLITGVSSGLGKTLAGEALPQGWTVVGTVRKEADRQKFEDCWFTKTKLANSSNE